jgi:hypothetical protein
MLPIIAALALALAPAVVLSDPGSDAAAACAGLNISSQLSLMRGFGPLNGYSRNSGCAYVCGKKTLTWDNGPQGFGDGTRAGSTTQFPSSLAAAATWDADLVYSFGVAMGEEWWAKGTNIFEGPGVNVARVQKNGRNFEYMSGEDPVLGAALLPSLVDGVQLNAMAIVKHYIGKCVWRGALALHVPCAHPLPPPLPASPWTRGSLPSPPPPHHPPAAPRRRTAAP